VEGEARRRTPPAGWVVPLLVAATAIPTFAAFWIGNRPALGALWAAASVGFGLVLALGGRSDTIRTLRGTEDDERTILLEYKATTATAIVLIVALLALLRGGVPRRERTRLRRASAPGRGGTPRRTGCAHAEELSSVSTVGVVGADCLTWCPREFHRPTAERK